MSVFCYGVISHVDALMPWGTSRECFKLDESLNRELLVLDWWVNKNQFKLKHIEVKGRSPNLSITEHFEQIYGDLQSLTDYVKENPCPIQLLDTGLYKTEVLALSESIQSNCNKQGDITKLDVNKDKEDDYYQKLELLCSEYDIEFKDPSYYICV